MTTTNANNDDAGGRKCCACDERLQLTLAVRGRGL